jgi:hypothetical protein
MVFPTVDAMVVIGVDGDLSRLKLRELDLFFV